MTYWIRNESPEARAHRYLESIELNLRQQGQQEIGGLIFYDAPMIGSDYLGVHAEDELSVSLLQHRLNALGERVRVEVVDEF